MWSDRIWNLGPLALETDALPTALCSPATKQGSDMVKLIIRHLLLHQIQREVLSCVSLCSDIVLPPDRI